MNSAFESVYFPRYLYLSVPDLHAQNNFDVTSSHKLYFQGLNYLLHISALDKQVALNGSMSFQSLLF